MIEFISATRATEAEFWTRTPLGVSLQRLGRNGRHEASIAFGNTRGLGEVYNARIDAADADRMLAFVHDDVWLPDFHLHEHVRMALQEFDVVGAAGCTARAPRQAGWAFLDASFRPIPGEHASGAVAHGRNPFGPVSYFGPTPAACELLDGVFIAAQAGRLREAGVRFDPRFRFHFYDIDFCRTARAAGLRVGTWPISLVHQSEGGFDTPDWHATYADYLAKWGD